MVDEFETLQKFEAAHRARRREQGFGTGRRGDGEADDLEFTVGSGELAGQRAGLAGRLVGQGEPVDLVEHDVVDVAGRIGLCPYRCREVENRRCRQRPR